MSETIRYRCPDCGRYSDEMKLLNRTLTLKDEILECKCGRVLRWSQMRKKTENIPPFVYNGDAISKIEGI